MASLRRTLKYGALDPVFGLEQCAQIPMAVLGTVMKFFQIVISISVGLAAGCIPVVGYNISAGRKDRARTLFTCLLAVEAIVDGVGFALLLPRWFGLDGVLYSMPVSDALTFVICLAVIYHTCRALSSDIAGLPAAG